MQESRLSSSLTKDEGSSADAPAESAVTGIEDVQADANDTVNPAQGVDSFAQYDSPSQGQAAARDGPPSVPENTEDPADPYPDPGGADDPHGSDRKPGWALQLQKQLQDSASGVQAKAQGLVAELWDRHRWGPGSKQDSPSPAEPPRAGLDQYSQHESTVDLDVEASERSNAAVDTASTGASRAVGEPRWRFSLHRSHSQLYVSTAESAAASASLAGAVEEALAASSVQRRPRRKVRLMPQAVLPEHGLREQPYQAMPALPTQPTPQLQQPGEGDSPASAAADDAEAPSTEEEEETSEVLNASHHQPQGLREEDTFSASEGASIMENVPEPTLAAVRDPASFELMAISPPWLLGHGRDNVTDTAAIAEAADAPEHTAAHQATTPQQETEVTTPESEAGTADLALKAAAEEHPEEQSGTAAVVSEAAAEEQQAEEQAKAHAELLQPASAPASPETQEATSGAGTFFVRCICTRPSP